MKVTVIAKNRKAYFNYEILTRYEAGIVLKGPEIKSIKNGDVDLKDSYVSFEKQQAYIINMNISNYKFTADIQISALRKRKLLLHRQEILKMQQQQAREHLIIIPLTLYLSKGKAKLEIALARAKKLHDKRQAIKTREAKRHIKENY